MDYKYGSPFHRYSALLLLLIVFYLLGLIFVSLFEQQANVKQRYENAYFQLNKYQTVVDTLSEHKAKNQVLIALLDTDNRFVVAQNKSLAVATFQQDLQQLIQQAGARLLSLQVVDVKDENETGILPVKIKIHVRLNEASLIKMLHLLESRQPMGFIYDLKIQHQAVRSSNHMGEQTVLDTYLEYTTFMSKQNDS